MLRPSDLEWRGVATPAAPGSAVTLRWLGTAGFAVEHDGHVLLLDPYVTRASLRACLLRPVASDAAAVARFVPRADAIVVGHTHFDHVLDVPAIARASGATVLGSSSAALLCRTAGLDASRVLDVEARVTAERPWETEVGPFRLRFVASEHSPLLFGRVPFRGDITDCDQVPMRVSRYRCGAVFGVAVEVAGRRLFHAGSANFVDAALRERETDLALVCVAGWESTPRFPERVVSRLAPSRVLLMHWDDFFRPLDRPVLPLPRMEIERFADRLRAASSGLDVRTVPALSPIPI